MDLRIKRDGLVTSSIPFFHTIWLRVFVRFFSKNSSHAMAKQMIERRPINCVGGSPEKVYKEIGNVTIPKLKKAFQLRTINA